MEAHGAATARSILTAIHADLVLTDIMMPGMNGLDLVRVLQRRGYRGHYLLMSGYSVAGAEIPDNIPFPAKPFSMDVLARAVRNAMAPSAQRCHSKVASVRAPLLS